MNKSKTKTKTKTKKEKNPINDENRDKLIDYFAFELFEQTTLPQMLNLVQNETRILAKSQIEGDTMPESEKIAIFDRMVKYDERIKLEI